MNTTTLTLNSHADIAETPRNEKQRFVLSSEYVGNRDKQYLSTRPSRAVDVRVLQCMPEPSIGEVINVGLIVQSDDNPPQAYVVDPTEKLTGLGCSPTKIEKVIHELDQIKEMSSEELDQPTAFGAHISTHATRFLCTGRYDLWIRDMLIEICGAAQ
jgi:hypothetical protein